MKIAIIYTPTEKTPNKEYISEEMLERLSNLLKNKYEPFLIEYHPYQFERRLKALQPHLIFNLAYGFSDLELELNEKQSDIVNKLERFSFNYIGSSYKVQKICEDKKTCYQLLQELGIEIPQQLDNKKDILSCENVIVKERYGACHRNVQVLNYKEFCSSTIDPARYITEEYISGKEYTVGVIEIENQPFVLVPGEVVFTNTVPFKVIGLNKTKVELIPAPATVSSLTDIAKSIYQGLGLRHYCRIDFRKSDDGYKCIDVNCLPNLDLDKSFFPILAGYSNIAYDQLIEILVQAASTEQKHSSLLR
jgi:D-alanine-D-alanine ligase-like ATP-grasp enzyme